MIFQRGNPLDYERWAADPGMAAWDYAHCLPYFKRMETCLAGADEYRGGDGPLVLERGPVTNPLFDAFFEAVQQAGQVLTSDVNGYRQEGFAAFDRNLHRGRRLSAARAYLHPVMRRPNLDVRCRANVTRLVTEGSACHRRGLHDARTSPPQRARRRGDPLRRRVQLAAAAPGVGHRRRRSPPIGRGRAGPPPARCRRAPPGPPRGLRAAREHAAGLAEPVDEVAQPSVDRAAVVGAPRSRCQQPVRRRRVHAEQRRRRVPQPDVPLPADRGALRRVGARRAGTATRSMSGRCTPTPVDRCGSRRPTCSVKPALRFNYLSTDQDRREWVEAIGAARHILGQPAFDPFDGGELSPGPGVQTDAEILDWVARDAETALHPSCTCRMGVDDMSVIDPDSLARPWRGGCPGGRRLVDAVRHERQHLRPGDDAGREGRRPDPRQHPAGPPSRSTSTVIIRPFQRVISFHHTDTFRIPDRSESPAHQDVTRGCVTSSPQWEGTT